MSSNAKQIVGDTRSGKPIYAYGINDEWQLPDLRDANFAEDDYIDAYLVFEVLVLRAKRKYGPRSPELLLYRIHLIAYAKILKLEENLDRMKLNLGCRDAFDLAALGRRLCRPEFQDF